MRVVSKKLQKLTDAARSVRKELSEKPLPMEFPWQRVIGSGEHRFPFVEMSRHDRVVSRITIATDKHLAAQNGLQECQI